MRPSSSNAYTLAEILPQVDRFALHRICFGKDADFGTAGWCWELSDSLVRFAF